MTNAKGGKHWWASARTGTLTPWSLAKVWALHTVSKLKNLNLEHTEVAKSVKKVGGGHPTPTAIQKLRAQFDDDPDWHTGKGTETGKRPGPKPRFTAQKKRCVAECAMAMSRRGEEVTVDAVQARAQRACTNPDTGELFDKKVVLHVFRTMCHDGDPSDTWGLYMASHKTALEPRILPLRLVWAKRTLQRSDSPGWYCDKLSGSKHGGKQMNSGDRFGSSCKHRRSTEVTTIAASNDGAPRSASLSRNGSPRCKK